MTTGNCYVEFLPFDAMLKDKLKTLLDFLLKLPEMSRVVLFGSYARMDYKAGSDFDILVLTSEEISREERGHLSSIFEERGADLVFYTEQQFEESNCRFVQEIRKDGLLLWKN